MVKKMEHFVEFPTSLQNHKRELIEHRCDVSKGRFGTALVLSKLLELGVDAMHTPHYWPFDIITECGKRIEVKFANSSIAQGSKGQKYETYASVLSPEELHASDLFIFVFNTPQGFKYYIVPKEQITCSKISFNPFSTRKSKYENYKDRWDLITK